MLKASQRCAAKQVPTIDIVRGVCCIQYEQLGFRHHAVVGVHCDKREERSAQLSIPYERSFSLVFRQEEWLVGATLSTWNFGSTGPCWSEIADLEPIFARSASAVTPSEKSSINTNTALHVLSGTVSVLSTSESCLVSDRVLSLSYPFCPVYRWYM